MDPTYCDCGAATVQQHRRTLMYVAVHDSLRNTALMHYSYACVPLRTGFTALLIRRLQVRVLPGAQENTAQVSRVVAARRPTFRGGLLAWHRNLEDPGDPLAGPHSPRG